MRSLPRAISPRGSAGDPLAGRIGGALRRWWLVYIDWRLQRLTIHLLSRMSDRQLKDMGLSRSQIEPAARGQAGQHALLQGRLS